MKTLLGIPVSKMDIPKYIKQLRFCATWMKKPRGTLEAATAFGKTFVAHILSKKLLKVKPDAIIYVVVPTRPLKKQWEDELKALGIPAKVFVINTIALGGLKCECDFLIVDEIHLMAADQFSKIFQLVKYKWILGLTATIERLDGKETLIKKYAPVFGVVTQREAIEKGWISDFIEVNLAVPLVRKDMEALEKLTKGVRHYMSKFGDFKVMQSCMNSGNAYKYAQLHYPSCNPTEKAKEIVKWAIQGQRYIAARQAFLYRTERKVEVTVELIQKFGLKTITFSQSTKFADEVAERVGSNAVVYHSYVPSQTRLVEVSKTYKTRKGAEKLLGINKEAKLREKDGTFEVYWKQQKVFGLKVLKEEAIEKFKDNRYKINTICTAKALDQGFNVKDCELGIDGSRTQNPTQHIQRTGRIARNYTYKDGTKKRGIYINLYVPNTRDEGWLRACQKNSVNVIWMDDVDEVVTFIKKTLNI